MDSALLQKLCRRIRSDILTITTQAGSGHPSSSLSAVELMATLFFKYLRYDMENPKDPGNDRVIFSKGHATPLYYALYAAAGVLSEKDLSGYRTFDSVLEGHPTRRFPYTEAATGSLGQGLSIGLGEALAMRLVHRSSFMVHGKTSGDQRSTMNAPRVFVLMGDGELAEGSVWEAAAAASFAKVNNLVLVVDVNRLGQSDPTMYGHDIAVYKKRFEAFGWGVVMIVDGNNLAQVDGAFAEALKHEDKPVVILAKTVKGKGVSFLEDALGWHGKPLSKDELPKALGQLGEVDTTMRGTVAKPLNKGKGERGKEAIFQLRPSPFTLHPPSYPSDKPVATRKAFGNALKRIGPYVRHMVVLDGDVKNSTYTEFFAHECPDRFVELFIAEQNMVGVAVGLSARGFHPVVSSFACFLTRAADQVRMAAFSGANIMMNGSHAGISIGEDGPSQMGLEDLALFRVVHGSTVLYPADAYAAEQLTEEALKKGGIVYIRTTRPETPILYSEKDTFPIGGSKVHRSSLTVHGKTSGDPRSAIHETATVVAAGITLYEALKAQQELAKEKIAIRVIDYYSVKPIDEKTLLAAAEETKTIIVVEDHYPEGGLGEAVASVLSTYSGNQHIKLCHLAVRKTPRSGRPAELLAYEEIDADAIIKRVKNVSA
ncbi:transketolase [Candidatus Gottesmanbacteria bacterium RBG_13_45_10]|uniref:Transketolase n=1 Tax=Candidatus Gottesmanbacteria bacterium RBG_13_45_10 TaxID=1798370 RepID=A0A1F5ZHI7_9BACT|nr:MAG: transketolase [Candidatus Gottesmanbacteria bacterium RBG_13_45_10]